MEVKLRRLTVYLALLFVFARAAALAQSSLADIARQANTVYLSGDYTTAIDLYESLVAAGVHDSTIYFNLGNAYYAGQDFGRAILYYRRAQALIPRDPDLNANLALARAQRMDLQGDETALVDSLAALTASILTTAELAALALFLWTVFFVVLIVSMIRAAWRDSLRALLVILGAGGLASLVLLGSRAYVNASRPAAIVVADTVAVMSGPGEDYLPIDELHSGAEMRILEVRGEWARFVLPNQRQGWAHRDTIEVV